MPEITIDQVSPQPARADPYLNPASLEFNLRARRFGLVRSLIQVILDERGHCEILDLGGTETYWKIGAEFLARNRSRISITLLNTDQQEIARPDVFSFAQGSATASDLFAGRRFDLVHSNSVVEHVGVFSDMQRFADNTRRLGQRYYVQTPNYWFAYEPHFRTPAFQYLPERVRVALIMRWSLGFFPRIKDRAEAEEIIYYHRLLSTRQMGQLFPDARVVHEKFFGLNKSIIAIRDGRPASER